MKKLFLIVVAIVVLQGSECEKERLAGMDYGLLETPGGVELHPMKLPWRIVGEEMENPEALTDAIESANGWFAPDVVFDGGVDSERFAEIDVLPMPVDCDESDTNDRCGTILISQGHVGTPDWAEGLDFEDYGGISTLWWDEDGRILFGDIILNIDYAYDYQTMRDTALHEFGHFLGYAHDERSLDLNSCMSSPPQHDCEYTEADRGRL